MDLLHAAPFQGIIPRPYLKGLCGADFIHHECSKTTVLLCRDCTFLNLMLNTTRDSMTAACSCSALCTVIRNLLFRPPNTRSLPLHIISSTRAPSGLIWKSNGMLLHSVFYGSHFSSKTSDTKYIFSV